MRVLLQRVSRAEVRVDNQVTGKIGRGLVVFVGIGPNDGDSQISWMVEKIKNLRIFDDESGRLNHSLEDLARETDPISHTPNGQALLVSQFTLYGECKKGRRPDFSGAAPVAQAREVYDRFVEQFRSTGIGVQTGVFQAMMEVDLVNDGPITLWIESSPLAQGPSRVV